MLYLYAIVGADHPGVGELAGIGPDGPPVRLVPLDGVQAAVSELDPTVEVGDPDVACHKQVVDELFRHGTVLPARFGTALADEAVLVDDLGPHAETLAGQLDALAGKVEVEVIARYLEESFPGSALIDDEKAGGVSPAIRSVIESSMLLELGEAVAADLERRRVEDGPRFLARLQEVAVAAAECLPDPEMVLRVSLLVEGDALADVDHVIDAFQEETEGSLAWEVWGPLPPYAFAGPEGRA